MTAGTQHSREDSYRTASPDDTDLIFKKEQDSLKSILTRMCLVMIAATTLAWITSAGTALHYVYQVLISDMAGDDKQVIALHLIRVVGWLSILWASITFALASLGFLMRNKKNKPGKASGSAESGTEGKDSAIWGSTTDDHLQDTPLYEFLDPDRSQEEDSNRGGPRPKLPGRRDA